MATPSIGKFKVLATLGQGAHSSILHIRRADDAADGAAILARFEPVHHHRADRQHAVVAGALDQTSIAALGKLRARIGCDLAHDIALAAAKDGHGLVDKARP